MNVDLTQLRALIRLMKEEGVPLVQAGDLKVCVDLDRVTRPASTPMDLKHIPEEEIQDEQPDDEVLFYSTD